MRKGIRLLVLCMIMLALVLTHSGCWDHREIEHLAIVLSMALDQAPEGKVRLTVQVISPRAMVAGGMAGGGAAGGGIVTRGFRNSSVEGNTVFDCIRLLSLESPRRLYFAHNQVVLISEELARNRNIGEVLDVFTRIPETRRSNWILISRSDISSVFELAGELISPSSQNIINLLDQQQVSSFFPKIQVGDFMELLDTEGADVFAPGIRVLPNEVEISNRLAVDFPVDDARPKAIGFNFKMGETAVFKGDRLAGWLNERESRGLLLVRGEVKGGAITLPCAGGADHEGYAGYSFEIMHNSSRIEPELTDGELDIRAKISVQANIAEAKCQGELDRPDVIESIERALAAAIRQEVEAALAKAQRECGADVFGFGEAIHRRYPGVWKELRDNWREIYPGLPVYVEVDAKISRTGQSTRPLRAHQ